MSDAGMTAWTDQMRATLVDHASLMAGYYKDLIARGLDENAALALTVGLQAAMITPRPGSE